MGNLKSCAKELQVAGVGIVSTNNRVVGNRGCSGETFGLTTSSFALKTSSYRKTSSNRTSFGCPLGDARAHGDD